MTQNTCLISPLHQRMIEDVMLRKLSIQTQTGYILAVKRFIRFLKRAPDTASAGDLRRYQQELVKQGIWSGSLNTIITGLKFFFETTLERPFAGPTAVLPYLSRHTHRKVLV